MNKSVIRSLTGILNISLLVLTFSGCSSKDGIDDPLFYVDPDIGGVGLLLQPTRPSVQQPNQAIRVYPVRRDYIDDQIRYFPLTLISHRNGELFGIMPFTGGIPEAIPVSSWDQDLEISTTYYLSTWLEDYNVTVEFAPGRKAGIFRMTFPDGMQKGIFLTNIRRGEWEKVSDREITAVDSFNGMKAFINGMINTDFEMKEAEISGRKRQYLELGSDGTGKVEFRYAISFISEEQAAKNLKAELSGKGFENLKAEARQAWEEVLGKIKVEGGTESQKRTFYTALYRCYERMVDITEDGRYYSNYDSLVHETDRRFFVDDWIWDTYLAHHPLRIILDPGLESDMIQSYVEMYKQSGWLPTFPILWGDNPCMNGFHSSVMVLDAFRKGIKDVEYEIAYEAMKKNSLEATMVPWRNGPACPLDTFYNARGYFPALHPGEKETVSLVDPFEKRQSVAVTLGHSYDDWSVGQMAKELGRGDDYEYFMKRSQNFRNLWNADRGFFMPKDDRGNWIDIDPKWDGGMGGRDYYDENNGWTYLWQVQHDLPGLIELMGGNNGFEKRLDRLFREPLGRSKYETWSKFPDFSGIVGQFSMGNEPSFHIPYLYNLTDSPWKTQKRIRMLLETWFPDNIFGIPGDEDGGGMSAFVVFSMMGFYPLTPGIPEYTIGSPLFKKVTISLPDGKKFIIDAPESDKQNKYVQKATLNGKETERLFFSHDDLMKGGILKLDMDQYPLSKQAVSSNQ
jgi:predicted alpha-1,2-mannosidase